jgi:PucR C-terminal helix-turn-helix domain
MPGPDSADVGHADVHARAQTIVDTLAEALGKPVLLDDESLTPVAYSRQIGDLDEVRLHSVLQRDVDPEVRADSLAFGVGTAKEAFWSPALPRRGMASRFCVPICSDRERFGYLWVLDPTHSLTEQDQELACQTGRELRALLDRDSAVRRAAETARQTLIARLLGRETDEPFEQILPALREMDIAEPDSLVSVFAFRFESGRVADSMENTLPLRLRLSATEPSHTWFISPGNPTAIVAISAPRLRADPPKVSAAVVRALEHIYGERPAIGWSGRRLPINEAPQAFQNARSALSIAEVGAFSEAVTTWTELGSWRTVAVLAQGFTNNPADLVPLIHPGILSLIREERGDLVHTLDVYLGLGGDARKTAATLHLHRSSLYYRLEKIAEAVGGDLHDGDARFELMLGIRLAYLARIYPT